jgi:large subunit ribosomal protein L29
MATKKYIELGEMSDTDLRTELDTINGQYQKLRFDHTIKGLDNPIQLRNTKRDLARLKTELRRREVAAMTPAQIAKRSKIRLRRRNG